MIPSAEPACRFCRERPAVWGAVAGGGPGCRDEREWRVVVCRDCLARRSEVDAAGLVRLARRCFECSRFASFAPASFQRAVHCRRHR
jgi:hypothetical protein